MIYYVDCHAAPGGDGSQEHPFDRIQLAAERAAAGDEVKVLPGIYRGKKKSVRSMQVPQISRSVIPLWSLAEQ